MRRLILVASAALAAGCTATAAISAPETVPAVPGAAAPAAAAAPAPAGSLYAREIGPMLEANCATCHLTGDEAGHMSLVADAAVTTLVGVAVNEAPALTRVVPGDPDNSYLVMKLEGTQLAHGGKGVQMPFGAPPLSKEQIALVRQWIKDGAKP